MVVKDLIVIIVSATVLGFAIGVIVGEQKQVPCMPPTVAKNAAHAFTCLSLKQSYVCDVNGIAVTYDKDGILTGGPVH